jgi:uncharacterized phage-associated protein
MNFHFDIDKSIAATAFLLQKNGGSEEILFLVKMLYGANRASLLRYGRSITGDSFSSMEHGPVVSQTYDFLKGNPRMDVSMREKWARFISPRTGNTVKVVDGSSPEIGYLSPREIELLSRSFDLVKSVRGKISTWAHRVFPECEQVPKNTSRPLPAERIFEKEHRPQNEITSLAEEINDLTWLKMALGK